MLRRRGTTYYVPGGQSYDPRPGQTCVQFYVERYNLFRIDQRAGMATVRRPMTSCTGDLATGQPDDFWQQNIERLWRFAGISFGLHPPLNHARASWKIILERAHQLRRWYRPVLQA